MMIIKPVAITAQMIAGCSILDEDPTAAWMPGTYEVGAERHVMDTHRVYRCAVAGASAISPALDPERWVDMRPTNRMAPFDAYVSTRAESTDDISYSITARFCDAIALFGLVGATYTITLKHSTDGPVIWSAAGTLQTHDGGWWSYLYGRRHPVRKLVFSGLPIRPAAEITITVAAADDSKRAIGMIVLGNVRSLAGAGAWGGTEYGVEANPVTYSYIHTDQDGQVEIRRRHHATNLRGRVVLPADQADAAVELLQGVLDVPVVCVATRSGRYRDGLTTFGLITSAPVRYDGPNIASIEFSVQGIV